MPRGGRRAPFTLCAAFITAIAGAQLFGISTDVAGAATPAPTVSAVSPTSGSTAGGTSVTITGTNFTGATAVHFGATTATSFTVKTATSITATAPAHAAGVVTVTVSNATGPSAISASDHFTYVTPAPTVIEVFPASGSTTGGTEVGIIGDNLTSATAVHFGTTAVTFSVYSTNELVVTAPAHAAGVVTVTVTTPVGTSALSAADQFFYVLPPTVTAISPTSGLTTGGTTVTITGTNLTAATAVHFGTSPALFAVDSATTITATAPGHAAGVATVTVTNAAGTSATSAADQFTFVAATAGITYLSTETAFFTAGFGASTVTVPFTPEAVGDLVVVDVSTDVTIAGKPSAISDTAGHIAWAPRVMETQTTTAPRFFTVWIGTVTATGTTTITITWTGGTTGLKEVTVTSWRSLHGATTKWSVIAKTSYENAGPGGAVTVPPLTATGSTQFYWCGTIADGSSSAATTHQGVFQYIEDPYSNTYAYEPNLVAGTAYSPKISYLDGIGIDALIFQASGTGGTPPPTPAPTVSAVSPTSGSTAGGTSVTITGTNLTGASAVHFGSSAATSFSVQSATSITATAPAHAAGTVTVTVTTTGGTSATSAADQFTYVAPPPTPAPTVSAVSPTSGSAAGGTSVTITGTNLTGASAVHFGSSAATSFTVQSATSITATAPAHASGTVTVTVTTTGGTSATSAADRFTYKAVVTKPVTSSATSPRYDLVASDGGIFTFGTAPFYGSEGGKHLDAPIVGMAAMPTGKGYWEVASDGGIFTFGTAGFYGSMGGKHLDAPIVGMAATPSGHGYWLVASDGGIFTFGTASFDGSMGGKHLDAPIVGMAATPTGKGYWEVASDGGIFTFGTASFDGSEGGKHLDAPIVGMAVTG